MKKATIGAPSSLTGMSVGGTKAPAVKKGTVRVPSASKRATATATTYNTKAK